MSDAPRMPVNDKEEVFRLLTQTNLLEEIIEDRKRGGLWAWISRELNRRLHPKPLVVNRVDRLAVGPSDPAGLQKSKRRAAFLLAMMDELTDRKLSPEKAIDVAMIWLKSPTALEDMEQWGKGGIE